jgi:Ca2+-binding RTX toxin-like protein
LTAGATLTNPNLTYTPNTGSTITDNFSFHVKDNGGTANGGQDTSALATVTLSLQANQSPTATPQTVTFQSGNPVTIQLTGTDGDSGVDQSLTFFIDALPARGTLRDSNNNLVTVGTALPTATVRYTPDAGFTGTDDFDFHVRDNGGTASGGDDTSDVATVTLEGPDEVGPPAPEPTVNNRVLRIQGTGEDDTITVELNAAGDTIEVIVNGAAAEEFDLDDVDRIRIRCGAGADEVTVSEDVLLSAHIRGGRGDDLLNGGGGDDRIKGRRGNDIINGGDGDDELFGSRGADEIDGEAGDDTIWGRRGNDIIEGSGGDDEIHGGRGEDEIDGGGGTDTANGGHGNDQIDNVENTRGDNDAAAVAALVDERGANNSVVAAFTAERLLDPLGTLSDDDGSLLDDGVAADLHATLVDAALDSMP